MGVFILGVKKIQQGTVPAPPPEIPEPDISGPSGSDILVEGGAYKDINANVQNSFNGTYKLVDSSKTGFERIWKHETENYWIFYCNKSYSKQWRFTPNEPDGWDRAGDFLVTATTELWPWEDDTWGYNSGYSAPGYIIPTITAGPDAAG